MSKNPHIAPVAALDGRTLPALGLNGTAAGFSGSSGSLTPETGQWRMTRHQMAVSAAENEPFPTGLVTITIPHCSIH